MKEKILITIGQLKFSSQIKVFLGIDTWRQQVVAYDFGSNYQEFVNRVSSQWEVAEESEENQLSLQDELEEIEKLVVLKLIQNNSSALRE